MKPRWFSNWQESPTPSQNPFVSDAFLMAIEEADVCGTASGWEPQHLTMQGNIQVPAYVKTHSWGEYVFDWAWANAYEQYGLHYYPKLVIAAPYTPSMGPRLLNVSNLDQAEQVIKTLKEKVIEDQLSGFHILFPSEQERKWLDQFELLKRTDVQFHWQNRNYTNFDDFLNQFSSRKRKNVRKERASIDHQGLTMRTLEGSRIDEASWHSFYQFYHATYLKRGRQGYLNRRFFDLILSKMRAQLVLVMADYEGRDVAGALFFKDEKTLYGRYWGCFEEFNNLHFEACYYQGIDYCIRHNLERFDPGTQGEHKIARGFEPTYTHSYHWLNHPQFFEAAKRFCEDEAKMTEQYFAEATNALPFRQSY